MIDNIGPALFGAILGALLTSWVQTFVFGNRLTRLETMVSVALKEFGLKHDLFIKEIDKINERCEKRHPPA